MSKIKPGGKANMLLNKEWVKHARPFLKKLTGRKRRNLDKKIIKNEITELNADLVLIG